MIIKNNGKGFSLLEILVVLGVMLALISVILYSLGNFRDKESLNGSVQGAVAILEEARELTLSGKEASSFGVHFQNDKIVRFKGGVYNPNDSANVVMFFDPLVSVNQIALNGGAVDVVFAKLTGETSAYGTVTIVLVSNPAEYKTVSISRIGLITVE